MKHIKITSEVMKSKKTNALLSLYLIKMENSAIFKVELLLNQDVKTETK